VSGAAPWLSGVCEPQRLNLLIRKGGKIAAKRMTPEQRREKMRRAAQARWAKAKRKNQ